MLREPRFNKIYGGLAEEDALARPPKGFAADTPHIEAIKLRHYFAVIEVDIVQAAAEGPGRDNRRLFPRCAALMRWLRRAVAAERP